MNGTGVMVSGPKVPMSGATRRDDTSTCLEGAAPARCPSEWHRLQATTDSAAFTARIAAAYSAAALTRSHILG